MGVFRGIVRVSQTGAIALGLVVMSPALVMAQCGGGDLEGGQALLMMCPGGEVEVGCEGDFPTVTAGDSMCCGGASLIWFCDGEEFDFSCSQETAMIGVQGQSQGLRLQCFEPRTTATPPAEVNGNDEPGELQQPDAPQESQEGGESGESQAGELEN